MLDDALNGTFSESSYDETKLSRLESKWKEFLGRSVLSNAESGSGETQA